VFIFLAKLLIWERMAVSTVLLTIVAIDVAIVGAGAQEHENVFLRDIRRSKSLIKEEEKKSDGQR